jgi:outer membrane lipoprotein SlyB
MKTPYLLAALAALVVGAGCRSTQTHASNTFQKSEQGTNYTVTIESIPTNRLTPTSREGDKPGAVYSSNIIAVYVNQVGKTNGGITNVTSISARDLK